jgi:CubicO group peptidase (beta-lactamase class C family)
MKVGRRIGLWVVAASLMCAMRGAPSVAQPGAPPGAASASARIDALFAQWDRPDSPGCSVGVRRGGLVVHQRGYGVASLESGVPLTPGSVFHVASVSKQFTAASILFLTAEGKLALDDQMHKFIPEWKGPSSVTVRHLLTHTAGLRDAFLLTELAAAPDSEAGKHDRLVRLLTSQRGLNSAPGAEYWYDNGGYLLLGEIVERVSGRSLRAYAQSRIFVPLGMSRTHFHDEPTQAVAHLASGYSRVDRAFRVARRPDGLVGNAGLFTSSDDLLRWLANLIDGRVGGGRLVTAMQQPTMLTSGLASPYGLGLMTGRHRGLRTVSHGGGDPGASAFALVYPDHDLAIAILCNLDDIDSEALARDIGVLYLSDRVEPVAPVTPATAVDMTASQLEAYAGLYRDPSTEGLLRLFVRGDALLGSSGAGTDGGWPTRPLGGDRFAVPGSPITLEFLTFSRDRPTRLRIVGERPAPFVLDRITPVTIGATAINEYAGTYLSQDLETTYTLVVNDGRLTVQIPGRTPFALEAIDRDGFAGPLVGVVRFARDTAGQVTGFTLYANGVRGLPFQRLAVSRE